MLGLFRDLTYFQFYLQLDSEHDIKNDGDGIFKIPGEPLSGGKWKVSQLCYFPSSSLAMFCSLFWEFF